jgi:hypothetical protein
LRDQGGVGGQVIVALSADNLAESASAQEFTLTIKVERARMNKCGAVAVIRQDRRQAGNRDRRRELGDTRPVVIGIDRGEQRTQRGRGFGLGRVDPVENDRVAGQRGQIGRIFKGPAL